MVSTTPSTYYPEVFPKSVDNFYHLVEKAINTLKEVSDFEDFVRAIENKG